MKVRELLDDELFLDILVYVKRNSGCNLKEILSDLRMTEEEFSERVDWAFNHGFLKIDQLQKMPSFFIDIEGIRSIINN